MPPALAQPPENPISLTARGQLSVTTLRRNLPREQIASRVKLGRGHRARGAPPPHVGIFRPRPPPPVIAQRTVPTNRFPAVVAGCVGL